MEMISIKDIVWDKDIYPRKDWKKATAQRYADAALSGDAEKFPPIIVDRKTKKLLDGKHRAEAWKIAAVQAAGDPEDDRAFTDIQVMYVDVPEGMAPKHYAAMLSAKHGDRVTYDDLEALAREEFDPENHKDDPEWAMPDAVEWGRDFGVSKSKVYEWVGDILRKQKEGRAAKAWRLSRLGWTNEEIANALGVSSEGTIREDRKNSSLGKIAITLGQSWNKHDIAAELDKLEKDTGDATGGGVREVDVLSAAMEGLPDQDRFGKLEWGLRTYDEWAFNSCDMRFGEDWPGRIPAQLVAHALFFFTEPGAVVCDPMAGGGVVSDTCLAFGRKCFSFDLSTRDSRPEIIAHHWDVDDMQFPTFLEQGRGRKIDLIFFDPPYFSKKGKEYEEKSDGDVPISSLPREEYLEFFRRFLQGVRGYMKPGGRVAFLNADWRDFQGKSAMTEKPDESITIFDYHKILTDTGWNITHRIACPMSNDRFTAGVVSQMQKSRILGVVTRDLLIAQEATNG